MERKTRTITLAIWGAILLGLFGPAPGFTESPQVPPAEEVSIFPEKLEENKLPPPGYPLTVRAQLVGTTDVTRPMRALVTVDSRVLVVLPTKAALNEYDFPEYVFQIHAPLNDLSYQFVLYATDEPAVFSDRLYVARSCTPNVEPVSTTIDPKLEGDALLQVLIERSDALDREATLLDEAGRILTDIKTLLEELER